MSEEVNSEKLLAIWDELSNTDLNAIDTSRPILAPGTYEFLVKDIRKDESKKGTPCLALQLSLQTEAQTVDGKTLAPGSVIIFHKLWLVVTPKYDYKKDLAVMLESIIGSRLWDPTLEAYKGQTIVAVTGIEQSTGEDGQEYPPREVIKRFMKKAA